jgi:D-lyxose ketol-isomerase
MALTREDHQKYQRLAKEYLDKAGIVLTPEEEKNIEVADLGLGEFESTGLALVTYINTDRVCAKELVLLPGTDLPGASASAGRW